MKRIIAAVAFSALAVPALADNRPFEQTELDRAVPQISEESASAGSSASARNLPFEQTELDRAVANVAQRPVGEARYVVPSFEQYNPA
jgi:hypothetical protein